MEHQELIDSANGLIYIEFESGEIVAAKEAMTIACFKQLRKLGSDFYQSALVYIYHVYKFNHPLAGCSCQKGARRSV